MAVSCEYQDWVFNTNTKSLEIFCKIPSPPPPPLCHWSSERQEIYLQETHALPSRINVKGYSHDVTNIITLILNNSKNEGSRN